MGSNLAQIKFYKNDPLLNLFIDKFKLNWRWAIIAYTLFWVVDSLIYAIANNLYFPKSGIISFTDDLFGQIVILVWSGSIAFGFYIWNGTAFTNLVWQLQKAGALKPVAINPKQPSSDFIRGLEKLELIWNHKFWVIGGLLISLFLWSWTYWDNAFFENNLLSNAWWNTNIFYQRYYALKMLFYTYLGIRIITMEILGIYSLYKLARWNGLTYQPFHPDRAGGFSDVGNYRLGLVYFLFGISIYFIFWIFIKSSQPPSLATIDSFILLQFSMVLIYSPFSYFLSLLTIHNFMKNEKFKLLTPLGTRLEGIYKEYSKGDLNQKEEFELISNQAELLSKTPEWPYNTSTLRRLIGTWTSFILGLLLAFFSELISNWLG